MAGSENADGGVRLRAVQADDLPLFFAHQQDAESVHMAAFTAKDPSDEAAFRAHWDRILSDETIIARTIVYDGAVAGHIVQFELDGEAEVSYWIDRAYWGKGIATRALLALLELVPVRPMYGRAVKDNIGSIRVLEKCGFVIVGEDKGFANARRVEVEEYVLKLE